MAAMTGAAMTGPSLKKKQWPVVILSTLGFAVCLAIWVMLAVTGIPIKKMLELNATQFGLLAAAPVLTGSLVRLPLGMSTDKYGGRIVFFVLMLSTVIPISLLADATEFWQFLVIGLFIGLAGGSFPVGTPYLARGFDRRQQGFALGIFGAGNGRGLRRDDAAARLRGGDADHGDRLPDPHLRRPEAPGAGPHHTRAPARGAGRPEGLEVLPVLLDRLRRLRCAEPEDGQLPRRRGRARHPRGGAARGVLRAFGGWPSDKRGAHRLSGWVMWVSWICLLLLAYPATRDTVATLNGPVTLTPAHNVWTFAFLLFVLGIAWAVGKAGVFKCVADDGPTSIGTLSGIVGLAGGLGGFALPIMFGTLLDRTGVRSTAFMLMYGMVCVSLIWMYWTEVRRTPVIAPQAAAFSLKG